MNQEPLLELFCHILVARDELNKVLSSVIKITLKKIL